jgi:hypothetical protein
MTATGTGLDAQLGCKTESVVGTKATPVTQFFTFNSASLSFDPSYIEGSGIVAGQRFKDVGQVGIARKSAGGSIEIPVMVKGFGWWLKHLIGSTANPASDGTLAYKQIHTPGAMRGLSFTAQVGKPEANTGTVRPTTYNGCKITDWQLEFKDNENTTLSMTVDAWDEDTATALAAASYLTGNQSFNFAHVNAFKIGGTPSTTGGETSIAGGSAVAPVITSLTLAGKYKLAADRYGLGNAGVKKEQLETDFVELTGSFEGEYDTTWDNPFKAGTTTAFQITSTGPEIESGKPYLLDVIIPAAKITKAPADVSGPGIVAVKGEFSVYNPGLADGTPPLQVKLRSTDSAAW